MIFGKTKKLLEEKENAFKLNLSNNYKEAAYKCWKEYEACIMDLRREEKISEKDYNKLIEGVNKYKRTFENIRR